MKTFKQYHAGVPVYGGGISRQLANNGLTVSIFGHDSTRESTST